MRRGLIQASLLRRLGAASIAQVGYPAWNLQSTPASRHGFPLRFCVHALSCQQVAVPLASRAPLDVLQHTGAWAGEWAGAPTRNRRPRVGCLLRPAALAADHPRLPRLAPAGAAQPAAQQSAFGAASSSCAASSVLLRSIATSAARLAEHTVAVPSMGESITEGTVATILKKPGEWSATACSQLTTAPEQPRREVRRARAPSRLGSSQ